MPDRINRLPVAALSEEIAQSTVNHHLRQICVFFSFYYHVENAFQKLHLSRPLKQHAEPLSLQSSEPIPFESVCMLRYILLYIVINLN